MLYRVVEPISQIILTEVSMADNKYDPDEFSDEYGLADKDIPNFGRHFASANRTFLNDSTNIHVRSEYTKDDYYYFRRSEQQSRDPKRIMKMCKDAYDNVGIIKNTIDLMTDFACKGVRIVHKNKKIQSFLRQWFKFVSGREVCQKMLRAVYRDGNCITERFDGDIKNKAVERWKAQGFVDQPVFAKKIPKKYIVHNIQSIEKVGDSVVTERPIFFFRPSLNNSEDMKFYTKEKKIELKTLYPEYKDGEYLELEGSRVYDYYYKKDDADKWAKPMTFAIMNELVMLDKVELADMSALDGAISNIRLWTLGSFEHNVFPSREGISKLRQILANNVGGGVMDLVWGPELSFKESNTQIHHFLGKEKYEAILTLIYAGLGIPPTLTGSSTASGFTNNFISIKTLVERLQYGRDILIDFWEKQIDLVMRAMSFTGVARVLFTYNVLSDEAAEKALLIDMVDRDLISAESVRDAFGFDPEIEQIKVSREARRRGTSVPYKASPYHNPNIESEKEKLYVQSGAYPPSQFGVQVDEKYDVAPKEVDQAQQEKFNGSNPEGGRPYNAKDKLPRKQKKVKVSRGFVTRMLWYSKAQDKIDQIVNPIYLAALEKKNLTNLTKSEFLELERMKFDAASNLKYGEEFTENEVFSVLNMNASESALDNYTIAYSDFEESNGKPTLNQIRQIYNVALALE